MSARAVEYRQLIEDVIAGGLLDEDEIRELKELVGNVQRKMAAELPAPQESAVS